MVRARGRSERAELGLLHKHFRAVAVSPSYPSSHMDQLAGMAPTANTSSQVPITPQNVALLLFGQDIYVKYLEFQDTIVLPRSSYVYRSTKEWINARDISQRVPRGHLPALRGYQTFMYWLHSVGKLYKVHEPPTNSKLNIAKCCGHALHPSITTDHFKSVACPVCICEQSTVALTKAWKAWQALGAPNRSPPYHPKGVSRALYYVLRSIWRFEKKRWVSFVIRCEQLSQELVEWEQDEARKTGSTYTFEELEEGKSVREALQFARANNPHHVDEANAPFVPRPPLNRRARFQTNSYELVVRTKPREASSDQSTQPRSSLLSQPTSPPHSLVPSRLAHTPLSSFRRESLLPSPALVLSSPGSPVFPKKAVTFAIDVVDTELRRVSEFERTSVGYKPGRHACSPETVWADTSFCNDKNFTYINETSELEKDQQNLLALTPTRNEDTDPTVDENYPSDTDSDTESSSSSSDSDSGDDLVPAPKVTIRRLAMSGLLETVADPAFEICGPIGDMSQTERELYASSM
jgi:hypothetical protein